MDENEIRTLLERQAMAERPPTAVDVALARRAGARRRIRRAMIPRHQRACS
jgi:hypothetical protein